MGAISQKGADFLLRSRIAEAERGSVEALYDLGVSYSTGRGGGERILTDGWQDEGPSWAPNGQFVMFHRTAQGAGATRLYAVPVGGGSARIMPTPVGGSDPSWSPINN